MQEPDYQAAVDAVGSVTASPDQVADPLVQLCPLAYSVMERSRWMSHPCVSCDSCGPQFEPRTNARITNWHLRAALWPGLVPPAGLHADGPASDQRFSSGMLVIEGSFHVDNPCGGA